MPPARRRVGRPPKENERRGVPIVSNTLKLLGYVGKHLKAGLNRIASIWTKEDETREESNDTSKDSKTNGVLPHWVQRTISPWIKREVRNMGKRTMTITTLEKSQHAVEDFWKEKNYIVSPLKKIPTVNRNRTITVTVAPNDNNEYKRLLNDTLKRQERFALLTPIEALNDLYLFTNGDVQIVFIERPVTLLRNNTSVQGDSRKYAWVTKGLNLPYQIMYTDGSSIVTNNKGTECWKYRKDRLICLRQTDEHSKTMVVMKQKKTAQEICKLITSGHADEVCSGLEKAIAVIKDASQKTLNPVEVLKILKNASAHLQKPERINGSYSCQECGCRAPTTLTPCAVHAFSLCNEILKNGQSQCGLRRTALSMIGLQLYDVYNPHAITGLVSEGLITQVLEPAASERRAWVEACRLMRSIMAGASYQRVWSEMVSKYATLQSPQQRVRAFLRRTLAEESEHLANDNETLARQDFFAKVQTKLKMIGVVKASIPLVDSSNDRGSWHWRHTYNPQTTRNGDISVMSWNVNGLKRRWLTGSVAKVVTEAGFPDILTLQEVKCTETTARRLKGFVEFFHCNGYRTVLWHNSCDRKKGSAGYAGVATFTKLPVEDHIFGMEADVLSSEARVLTTVHPQFSLVNTYVPNSGGMGDKRSLSDRLLFDKGLREHINKVRKEYDRPCIWIGDINVAPSSNDYHPSAFRMIPSKWPRGQEPDPGFLPSVSTEEVESYHDTLNSTNLVNLWDAMKCLGNNRTWYPRNTLHNRTKGFGARLDHIHGPASLVDKQSPLQCVSIQNLWKLGNSDHSPLLAKFATNFGTPDSTTKPQADVAKCVERLCGVGLPYLKDENTTFSKLANVLSRVYTREVIGVEPLENEIQLSTFNDISEGKESDDSFQETFNPYPSVADFDPHGHYPRPGLVAEPGPTAERDPMPYTKLCWQLGERCEQVETLIDSGSYFDLIHQDLAVKLLNKSISQIMKDQDKSKLPTLRSANGALNNALARARVRMSLPGQNEDFLTERDVFVFKDLPVNAILGAKTCQSLRSCLDWETMEWRARSATGRKVVAELTVKETERYRSVDVMLVTEKVIVYPGEHRRIATKLVKNSEYRSDSSDTKHDTTRPRVVLPLRNKINENLKVPWGITQSGDWIQVANLGKAPVSLKPGDTIASAQYMEDAFELKPNSNVDRIDKELYPTDGTLPEALVCTCAQNRLGKASKNKKVTVVDKHVAESDGKNIYTASRPASKSVCDSASEKNSSSTNSCPGKCGEELEGNIRSSEITSNSSVDVSMADASDSDGKAKAKVVEVAKPCVASAGNDHASGQNHVCMLCVSHSRAQWKATVAKLSMAEIDEELRKEPLNTVDLSTAKKLLVKRDFAKLKRWVVARKATFMDGPFTPADTVHKTRLVIETPDGDPGHRAYPDRHNPTEYAIIQEQVDKWLKNKVIQESVSPWSSNIVLVRKADRKARVAIDYRKLNKATKKDAYMLPRVDQVFDVMHGVQFVSVTDCHSAFLQIPIDDKETREKTAFVTPDGGLYEFLRCPFGLVNAPAVWQRLIDEALVGYRWKFVLAYVDDICIFTKSDKIEDHLEHLDLVFDRLDQYGLSAKASKTCLAHKELPFLGHIISVDGIKPDPKKVSAMADAQAPHDLTSLRSTLGKFSYYRKFVKDFAKIASPLTALLSKGQKKKKGEAYLNKEAEQAFEKLKQAMCKEPIVLAHPD